MNDRNPLWTFSGVRQAAWLFFAFLYIPILVPLMIGNLIQLQFGTAHNWPFGAALSFALLAFVLLAMLIHNLRFRANAGGGQP